MIVATAGHIDHGKTTLVKMLTGIDTDRLPEERRRGISIDLGFAYCHVPEHQLVIGFVDVPGHEHFISNALAGMGASDFALCVIAADDGVMPQTIEHLNIFDLLSVRRGVAVITKIDKVSSQRLEDVVSDVRSLLANTTLAAAEVLSVSSVSGIGVDALRSHLIASARAVPREEHDGKHFRFSVDRAFQLAGHGTVVTGTVYAGEVTAGDRLTLSPGGARVRVRGVQKDRSPALSATMGERCALNLAGIELSSVSRGDWLVCPLLHHPVQCLDVRLRVLESHAKTLRHWSQVHLHHGAAKTIARISIPGRTAPVPGGVVVG